MKWRVSAAVSGGKYIGEFEADTGEQAVAKAGAKGSSGVHLCHQCVLECENAETHSFVAEGEDGTTYEEPEVSWEERARAAGWKPPRKKK